MKKSEWNEALNHIDDDLVESYVAQKELLSKKKKSRGVWLRVLAVAACFAITLGAIGGALMLLGRNGNGFWNGSLFGDLIDPTETDMGNLDVNAQPSEEKKHVLKAWTWLGEFREEDLRYAINKYERDYSNIVLTENSDLSVSFETDFEISDCSVLCVLCVDENDSEYEISDGALNFYLETDFDNRTVNVQLLDFASYTEKYHILSYVVRVKSARGKEYCYYFRVDYSNYKGDHSDAEKKTLDLTVEKNILHVNYSKNIPDVILTGDKDIVIEDKAFFEKLVSVIDGKYVYDSACNCTTIFKVKIDKYLFYLNSDDISIKVLGEDNNYVDYYNVNCTEEEMSELYELLTPLYNDNIESEYMVSVSKPSGISILNERKAFYAPGEKVIIELEKINGHYEFTVSGDVEVFSASTVDTQIYTFFMPAEDVTVNIQPWYVVQPIPTDKAIDIVAQDGVLYFNQIKASSAEIILDTRHVLIEDNTFVDKLGNIINGKSYMIRYDWEDKILYHIEIGDYYFRLHAKGMDVAIPYEESAWKYIPILCSEEEMNELFEILEPYVS